MQVKLEDEQSIDSCSDTHHVLLALISKEYDLNLSEYDHIEWLIETGLANAHNIDDVLVKLGYPKKTSARRTSVFYS